MDQQEHVDVADAATGAESTNYSPGATVYDADGEKLGTVSDRQDKEDFLVVHKGLLFSHDAYIPRAAINHSDVNGIHLRRAQGRPQGHEPDDAARADCADPPYHRRA